MKKLLFMLMALILPVSLFAAEVEPSTGSEFVINLGTFTGDTKGNPSYQRQQTC